MKKLIIINGTMGVGKTTVCSELFKMLKPSAFLDGDWCWNMNPFIVTEENKKMVINNIIYMLRSYLMNSGYEYVIFCWVIHQEYIFEQILEPLKDLDYELFKITLICSEKALRSRLEADVQNGIREADVVECSVSRLNLYNSMNTTKIDVSKISHEQTANKIFELVRKGE